MLEYELLDANRVCQGIQKVRVEPATRSAVATCTTYKKSLENGNLITVFQTLKWGTWALRPLIRHNHLMLFMIAWGLTLGNMVSWTSRITDFFNHSAHASKRAKRDNSLPNSPEALSSEGPIIVDISEEENTTRACRLHSPSSEVESTDSIRPQSTALNKSDNQPCDSFHGGSYAHKSKHKIFGHTSTGRP